MRLLIILTLIINNIFGAWIMFNDGSDTYIYNNITGDIYIRHKKGGENYEDNFIKMPSGIIPKDLKSSKNQNNNKSSNTDNLDSNLNIEEQNRNLQNKFQDMQSDMLNKVLE